MKRKIILAFAFALSLTTLLLTSSDSRVAAQNQIKIVADTGVVTLGPNQELRLSLLSGYPTTNGDLSIRLRQTSYAQPICTGGVCQLAVESQTVSDVITVAPNEAVSINFRRCIFPICGGIRGVVLSDRQDVKVNAMIIDTLTGEVVAVIPDYLIDVSGL